jgi:hypothetical protein
MEGLSGCEVGSPGNFPSFLERVLTIVRDISEQGSALGSS